MAAILASASCSGCGEATRIFGSTFHQKFGWKAEDYFSDRKVIALCHAVEANDIGEIDRLVASGADVNASGKDNMTPLLWAFPDNKLERFKHLLELGADPNVITKSDFNTHGGFHRGGGDSVTHMACGTEFPGYFEAVFTHGGDANLVWNGSVKGRTPLFSVMDGLASNKEAKVRLLIAKGADLNHMDGTGNTPAMWAVNGAQYDIDLILLEAGADYKIYMPKSNRRLVHLVAMGEDRRPLWTSQQAADYEKLVKWLEDHGESIQVAQDDIKRWQSWNITPEEYRRKMDAEIAEREAREKVAAEKGGQK